MNLTPPTPFSIEIDKLTNSIENAITGEVFDTEVVLLTSQDEKQIKKKDWQFDWKRELRDTTKQTYKLTTVNNANVIHGLISISDNHDHVFMHLVENATFNKGKQKLYKGVAGNLVAFACKTAFIAGYDGVVSFISKSQLIEHYKKTLGAKQFVGNRMFIDTQEALTLVRQYFNDFDYGKL